MDLSTLLYWSLSKDSRIILWCLDRATSAFIDTEFKIIINIWKKKKKPKTYIQSQGCERNPLQTANEF